MERPSGHAEAKPLPAEMQGDEREDAADEAGTLATQLVEADRPDEEFAKRLRIACRGESAACVALKVGMSKEAVRRILQTGRAPARFIQQLCRVYGANGHWLATGEGPASKDDTGPWALMYVSTEDLLAEVGHRLGKLVALLDTPEGKERLAAKPGGDGAQAGEGR